MSKIKVSTVKYANSYPMNWGLLNGPVSSLIDISFDHPSGIAARLTSGSADIGLLPVAAIPSLAGAVIIGNHCIGTTGRVRTVMLLSNSSIDNIRTIWLDHRSVTSVNLARVLAKYYWRREFRWRNPGESFDYASVPPEEGIVIIGDQCFAMEKKFSHGYDLGETWREFTGLPFVFACWVAASDPGEEFVKLFNASIDEGLRNVETAVDDMNSVVSMTNEEIAGYLRDNIDYSLDEPKRRAMELFINYMKTI